MIRVALPVDLPTLLSETRAKYIEVALNWSNGNVPEAARLLGISRQALWQWLHSRRPPEPEDDRQLPLPLEG